MDKLEYFEKLAQIKKEAEAKEWELQKQCARANDPYKIGDVFTDYIGSLIIESKKVFQSRSSALPQMVYFGTELTKSGKPRKVQEGRGAYQRNDIKNNS